MYESGNVRRLQMEELIEMLNKVEDSYFEFVSAMVHYAEKNTTRLEILTTYISENPYAQSADIIKFVSDQPDFADDAAYMRVG